MPPVLQRGETGVNPNGLAHTTTHVVPVVIVVLHFFGRQLEQLIQQSMLSPLCWLSCYIFRTTTGTTCTTKKVVPVVLVVVLYSKDDNGNNLYNKESCPRCSGCRVIFLGRQLEQLIQQSMFSQLCWLSCIFLDDNRNNLYNEECCSCCVGCRVIFLGRQREQLIQQSMLSPLFLLSCYIFRTTT